MASNNAVPGAKDWAAFCEQLKQAGEQILRPEAPAGALDRAEGYRYLTRLLRIGLEMHLEFADADFPGFFAPSHETGKIGADNPDNLYLMARISGVHDYVIRGQRGTVSYLSFGSQKGGYESDGKMVQTGFLDAAELAVDADGKFEIMLSQNEQPGNWLRLEPESNAIIVRQTFLDRGNEQPASMAIRRRDASANPQQLSAEHLRQGLERAAGFVNGTATLFANWAQSYQAHVNELPPADQALCQSVGGDPNIFYYHSAWRLAPDEALVIHVTRVPECRFWNLQLNNYWMESLDYRHHRICINQHAARLDADGGVTLVIAHGDPGPGHPNWLDTAGHDNGTLCLRWVGASHPLQGENHPRTRIVPFAEITARNKP